MMSSIQPLFQYAQTWIPAGTPPPLTKKEVDDIKDPKTAWTKNLVNFQPGDKPVDLRSYLPPRETKQKRASISLQGGRPFVAQSPPAPTMHSPLMPQAQLNNPQGAMQRLSSTGGSGSRPAPPYANFPGQAPSTAAVAPSASASAQPLMPAGAYPASSTPGFNPSLPPAASAPGFPSSVQVQTHQNTYNQAIIPGATPSTSQPQLPPAPLLPSAIPSIFYGNDESWLAKRQILNKHIEGWRALAERASVEKRHGDYYYYMRKYIMFRRITVQQQYDADVVNRPAIASTTRDSSYRTILADERQFENQEAKQKTFNLLQTYLDFLTIDLQSKMEHLEQGPSMLHRVFINDPPGFRQHELKLAFAATYAIQAQMALINIEGFPNNNTLASSENLRGQARVSIGEAMIAKAYGFLHKYTEILDADQWTDATQKKKDLMGRMKNYYQLHGFILLREGYTRQYAHSSGEQQAVARSRANYIDGISSLSYFNESGDFRYPDQIPRARLQEQAARAQNSRQYTGQERFELVPIIDNSELPAYPANEARSTHQYRNEPGLNPPVIWLNAPNQYLTEADLAEGDWVWRERREPIVVPQTHLRPPMPTSAAAPPPTNRAQHQAPHVQQPTQRQPPPSHAQLQTPNVQAQQPPVQIQPPPVSHVPASVNAYHMGHMAQNLPSISNPGPTMPSFAAAAPTAGSSTQTAQQPPGQLGIIPSGQPPAYEAIPFHSYGQPPGTVFAFGQPAPPPNQPATSLPPPPPSQNQGQPMPGGPGPSHQHVRPPLRRAPPGARRPGHY